MGQFLDELLEDFDAEKLKKQEAKIHRKKYQKEYQRKWAKNNKEKRKESNRIWYLKNREIISKKRKEKKL